MTEANVAAARATTRTAGEGLDKTACQNNSLRVQRLRGVSSWKVDFIPSWKLGKMESAKTASGNAKHASGFESPPPLFVQVACEGGKTPDDQEAARCFSSVR